MRVMRLTSKRPDEMTTIVFVDDEPRVLEGIARMLKLERPQWEVRRHTSGAAAIADVTLHPPHVLVSDMKMPEMDGATLLKKTRQFAPDAIRILLTGHADLNVAMLAVNEGHIFRILTKPCPSAALLNALDDALEQYRLVTGDRQLLEEKLAALSAQLLRAERLATLGTFAGGVAQELGLVAQGFKGAMGMLRDSAARRQPCTDEALKDLARVGSHLETHVAHLVEMARPSCPQERELDFGEVIRDILSMLRVIGMTKHVGIEVDTPPTPVRVVANPTRLEQVLMNLVMNAAHAVAGVKGRPGHVRVIVREDPELGAVSCRIEDNGDGIPEMHRQKVFTPYFTTKPRGEGTGLGLSVVKQIVESYAGTISMRTEVGVGTTFEFSIPADHTGVAKRADAVLI